MLDAEIPWLVMLEGAGGGWVIAIYGVVVGWTLVETSVGSLHALVDRIDKNLDDLPAGLARRLESLSAVQRATIAGAFLVIAMALSRVGIIDLVATGYGLLAWGFIGLLAIPLLTVGVYRITGGGRAAPG